MSCIKIYGIGLLFILMMLSEYILSTDLLIGHLDKSKMLHSKPLDPQS